MKKAILFVFLPFCFIVLVSCGKKGPLLPPVPRVPHPVENLQVKQIGQDIHLTWNNPDSFQTGEPLTGKAEVELWAFSQEKMDYQKEPVRPRTFRRKAGRIASLQAETDPDAGNGEEAIKLPDNYHFTPAEENAYSRVYIFSLRIRERNRMSPFSHLVSFAPRILSLPPSKPLAEIHEEEIKISWTAPSANFDRSKPPKFKGYDLFRREKEGNPVKLNDDMLTETEYKDRDFVFGNTYFFSVRAVLTAEKPGYESLSSEELELEVKDTFPPAAPTGLMAVPGSELIALRWDAPDNEDLSGYKVWRRSGIEKEYILLTQAPIPESSFTDRAVKNNIRYFYAVTAVDESGNESPKSAEAAGVVRREPS
jgi:hypothetical protein